MAPSVVQNVTEAVSELSIKETKGKALLREPLKSSGSLDQFAHEDLTPSTGTEFASSTQLSQLLKAHNADELIRDLAILSIPILIFSNSSLAKVSCHLPKSGHRHPNSKDSRHKTRRTFRKTLHLKITHPSNSIHLRIGRRNKCHRHISIVLPTHATNPKQPLLR